MGKLVSLDQLRPELVLSADIVDSGGRLLLPSGTTLSEKHLRFCQMWGVTEAEIRTDGAEAKETELSADPVRLEAASRAVLPRFRHVDPTHPVIEALVHHAVDVELARPA